MNRPKGLKKLIDTAEYLFPANSSGELYLDREWVSTYDKTQTHNEIEVPVLIDNPDEGPVIWAEDGNSPYVCTHVEVVDFIVEARNLFPELLKYIKHLEENQK